MDHDPVRSFRPGLFALGALAGVPMAVSAAVEAWPFELLSHFMVAYALGAALLALACAARRRVREAVLAAFVAAVYVAYAVAPLHVGRSEHAGAVSLRVLSANMRYDNRDAARLTAWMAAKQPDVVIVQELTPPLRDALAPSFAGFADRIEILRDDAFGIGVYSRRAKLARFDASAVSELAIAARFDHEGRTVTLISVHTFPPITPERIRDRQLAALGSFVKPIEQNLIVAGDLNITSWSPVFRKLTQASGLVDSRRGFGVLGSWPSGWPALLRLPIDHVLTSRDIVATGREVGPDVGSDHRPIFADLALR